MKIALCISGCLRNFEDTYYSFKEHLIKHFEVDTFFYGVENKKGKLHNEEKLIKLYAPQTWVINSTDYYNNLPCKHKVPATYSFYNVYKCNELKKQFEIKNNFLYDYVIRARTDYFWFRDITQEELKIAQNYILTPIDWSFKGVNSYAISDVFAIGTSLNMDKYAETFKYIDKYSNEVGAHPETLMGYHLHKQNIPVKEINRHVIFEYPSPRTEKYISPYKFTKLFLEPNIPCEDEFLRIVSNKRKEF